MTDNPREKRRDHNDRFASIETSIGRRRHPVTMTMTLQDLGLYIHLICMCRDLSRDTLPPVYSEHNYKYLAEDCRVDSRTVRSSLAKLLASGAVTLVEFSEPGANYVQISRDFRETSGKSALIHVVGLRDKWDYMVWKCAEYRGVRDEGRGVRDEVDSPPSVSFVSQFPEVIESLRSINAQGYRDLSGTPEFDKVLSAEKVRLGGLDRINREAQRFALYVEGQLQLGKEKRTKRSRPYKRFADWLARERPGDNTHGTNGNNGEYAIDRARRELAESIAARQPKVGSLSGD